MAAVVNTEVQFVDDGDLEEMNGICSAQFAEPYPARTSYDAAFLWKGAYVQISAAAMAGER